MSGDYRYSEEIISPLLNQNSNYEINPEEILLIEDLNILITLFPQYLSRTNIDFYVLYIIDVKLNPWLAWVPQNFYYRYLRKRNYSWIFVVAIYFLILFFTCFSAILMLSANKGASFKFHGENCAMLPSDNNSFIYYSQVVGMCNSSQAQSFSSSNCILWTNSDFWKDFESKANGPYSKDSVSDAKSFNGNEDLMKFYYFCGVIACLSRPIESLLCFLYSKKAFSRPFLRLKAAISITFLWVFSYLLPALINQALGNVGGADVTAEYISENWKSYYECDYVSRTTLWPQFHYSFSACSLLIIWLLMIPDLLNSWIDFFCCCQN